MNEGFSCGHKKKNNTHPGGVCWFCRNDAYRAFAQAPRAATKLRALRFFTQDELDTLAEMQTWLREHLSE